MYSWRLCCRRCSRLKPSIHLWHTYCLLCARNDIQACASPCCHHSRPSTLTVRRTKNFRGLVTAPTGVDGAKPAAQHYLFAPIYMQNNNNKHPVGVSGKEAKAKGADAEAIFAAIHAAQAPFVRAGKALNYEAVRDWWKPRNAAFKADPSKSVSVDDVVAFLQSDAAWLHPAVGKTDKVQRIVSIDKSKPFEAP